MSVKRIWKMPGTEKCVTEDHKIRYKYINGEFKMDAWWNDKLKEFIDAGGKIHIRK